MNHSIFLLLLLCINISLCGADKYERSSQFRRDYTKLVARVHKDTGEPLIVSTKDAYEHSEPYGDGNYKCTWHNCSKPLGRFKKGMSNSGIKDHTAKHMGMVYKCMPCGKIFEGYSTCYDHIMKCNEASIPPIKDNWKTWPPKKLSTVPAEEKKVGKIVKKKELTVKELKYFLKVTTNDFVHDNDFKIILEELKNTKK